MKFFLKKILHLLLDEVQGQYNGGVYYMSDRT